MNLLRRKPPASNQRAQPRCLSAKKKNSNPEITSDTPTTCAKIALCSRQSRGRRLWLYAEKYGRLCVILTAFLSARSVKRFICASAMAAVTTLGRSDLTRRSRERVFKRADRHRQKYLPFPSASQARLRIGATPHRGVPPVRCDAVQLRGREMKSRCGEDQRFLHS